MKRGRDEVKETGGRRFFLGVVNKDHVLLGKEAGFVQLCHGKKSGPLSKLSVNDLLVYYSPSEFTKSKTSLKSFTAIAKITGEIETPPSKMSRRGAQFLECNEAAIAPLTLSWKPKEGKKWGMALRSGFKELTKEDFLVIAKAMGLNVDLL